MSLLGGVGLSTSQAPNTVKTALDVIFDKAFDQAPVLYHTDATDGQIFMQMSSDKSAEINELTSGLGLFGSTSESEEYDGDEYKAFGQKTFTHVKFAKSVPVTREMIEDNQHGLVEKMVKDLGNKGRLSRDNDTFGVIRDAQTGSTYTLPIELGGGAIVQNSNTDITGGTIDNLTTGALSDSTLETMVKMANEQKDHRGIVQGRVASCLLVPPALIATAVKVTESERVAGSENNDINLFSNKYAFTVKSSIQIGEANSGSDTAHYLFAGESPLVRYERSAIATRYIPWSETSNDQGKYLASFRQSQGAISYIGIIGSTGA